MSNKLTLSASDRISSLLDEASFVEVGAYVTARNTDFNMQENDTPFPWRPARFCAAGAARCRRL